MEKLVQDLIVFFGEHDIAGIDAWHCSLGAKKAA